MNDHLELIDIIRKLGGHASTKAIAEEYCRQHHMLLQTSYLSVIKTTLSYNGQKIVFNEELDEWEILQDEVIPPVIQFNENADETIKSKFIGRSVAELYKPGEAVPVKVFNNNISVVTSEIFKSRFEKDSEITATPVYKLYYDAAAKLWNMYSDKYDLRPRSIANAKKGKNRGVEFYRDGKHIIGISIGKTTTIYVHDEVLRNRLNIDYEIDPQGEYRHTYNTVDEVIAVIDGII